MKKSDPILERIEAFNEAKGGGVIINKVNGGYSLFLETTGAPIARLRPSGKGGKVEVKWWRNGKWANIGDFGPMVMSLDDALKYIASQPIFWIRA